MSEQSEAMGFTAGDETGGNDGNSGKEDLGLGRPQGNAIKGSGSGASKEIDNNNTAGVEKQKEQTGVEVPVPTKRLNYS